MEGLKVTKSIQNFMYEIVGDGRWRGESPQDPEEECVILQSPQMNYVGARIVIPTQVHHTCTDCDYEVLTNG